jgi:flagellar basal-body rod modification protein FlgD
MISSTSTSTISTLGSTSTSTATAVDQNSESQDRFLKLLVAQLNSQDPMNPMDNAQMTSQMAQINTVTGIQQVNDTLKNMATQFNAMQLLQGSSLVGREVMIESNSMSNAAGVATGTFDLAGHADMVKVDIISPAGQLLDTLNLGSKSAGELSFNWDSSMIPADAKPTFKVTASHAGGNIASTPLAFDKVLSVSSANGAMTLQLQSQGALAYSSIKSIL